MTKKPITKGMFATFVALLSLMSMMPLKAGAQNTVVNVVEQTGKITQTSTLYVGEVVLNGQQSFYYLYSEDMTNSETVFASVRDCLHDFKGGIFSALVPDLVGESENKGIAVCSNAAYESMMNAGWKNASQAGQACLPGMGLASSSSDNLFDTDAKFAENCSNYLTSNGIDLVDDEGDPLAPSGALGVLSSSATDDVSYTVDGGQLVKLINRHISYTYESVTVIYTRAELLDPDNLPLTFEALEDGTITVNLDDGATFNPIQYNLNGTGWTNVTWNTPIALAANDVISFRGDNGTCYATDETNYWAGFHFQPSNPCYVYGNMMSLIDKDGFATNTTLTETYTFFRLFQRSDYEPNTAILNHPTKDIVLPATTLTDYCYDGLFADAPNITRAPELPATTLAEWCYSDMFSGTAITTAPALPATTLAPSCYADMFMNCKNLTTAPELPAATLAEGCYSSMLAGCTSLNYVKCFATDISADYCTADWLWNVAPTGTFVKEEHMYNWAINSAGGIPAGWTMMNNLVLVDNGNNNEAIDFANIYALYEVTLSGRTLYKDGAWNTLCLPFDVTLAGSVLEGAIAYPLDYAFIAGLTLHLDFNHPADKLLTGTPYIIKWNADDSYVDDDAHNIVNPVFSGVYISNETNNFDNNTDDENRIRFLGTYKAIEFTTADKSILFMGAENELYYPKPSATSNPVIGACRAYFKIGDDTSLVRELTEFDITFGETTSISDELSVKSEKSADAWYTLDGRKLSGKPTQKGVYINNGFKVVVK